MFEREPEKPHFAKIAVLMFGVLLLSTAAAWLLVAGSDRASDRGARIVRELHDRGLEGLWTRPHVRWYLQTYAGRIIGWSVSILAPDGSDFHGLEVDHLNGSRTRWERWKLNRSATAGIYRAGLIVRFPGRQERATDTVISYADGKVSLLKTDKDLRATTPAPANYVPEGSLGRVALLTGLQGKRAYFHMVFNEREPVNGEIDFGTIMLQPVDASSLGIEGATAAVRYRTWVPRNEDRMMAYDAQGQLLGLVSGEYRLMAVNESDVRRSFPDAGELVAQLARSLNIPPAPRPPGDEPIEKPNDELTMNPLPPNGKP